MQPTPQAYEEELSGDELGQQELPTDIFDTSPTEEHFLAVELSQKEQAYRQALEIVLDEHSMDFELEDDLLKKISALREEIDAESNNPKKQNTVKRLRKQLAALEGLESLYREIESLKQALRPDPALMLSQKETEYQKKLAEIADAHEIDLDPEEDLFEMIAIYHQKIELDINNPKKEKTVKKLKKECSRLEALEPIYREIQSLKQSLQPDPALAFKEKAAEYEAKLAEVADAHEIDLDPEEDLLETIATYRQKIELDLNNPKKEKTVRKLKKELHSLEILEPLYTELLSLKQALHPDPVLVFREKTAEYEAKLAEIADREDVDLDPKEDLIDKIAALETQIEQESDNPKKQKSVTKVRRLSVELKTLKPLYEEVKTLREAQVLEPENPFDEKQQAYAAAIDQIADEQEVDLDPEEDLMLKLDQIRREIKKDEGDPKKEKAVRKARALLSALERLIPQYEALQSLNKKPSPSKSSDALHDKGSPSEPDLSILEVSEGIEDNETLKKRNKNQPLIDEYSQKIVDVRRVMPLCAEKVLMELVYELKLKCLDLTGSMPSQSELINRLGQLRESLKVEKLATESTRNALDRAEKLARSEPKTEEQWLSLSSLLGELLKMIQPFDIRKAIMLIEESDKASSKIEKRHVLLLLGYTGAGKSTTIHFLAGSRMRRNSTTLNIFPETVKKRYRDFLESITVGDNSANSETRYISAVPLPLKGDLVKLGQGQKELIACDTPGFEDTSGPAVDVANAISLIKAVKRCQTVRPLILINAEGIGNKFTGLKKLAYTLAQMVPHFQDKMFAFTFAFTKFEHNNSVRLESQLKDVLNKLREDGVQESEPVYFAIVEEMLRQVTLPDLTLVREVTEADKDKVKQGEQIIFVRKDKGSYEIGFKGKNGTYRQEPLVDKIFIEGFEEQTNYSDAGFQRIEGIEGQYDETQARTTLRKTQFTLEKLNEYVLDEGGASLLENKAIFINPMIADSRDQLLMRLLQKNSLDDPQHDFKLAITSVSKAIVHEQVQNHTFHIINALKRQDYELVRFKLDELKQLYQAIEEELVIDGYKKCLEEVKNHLESQISEIRIQLKRCFHKEMTLQLEDVTHYERLTGILEKAKGSLAHFFNQEVFDWDLPIKLLDEQYGTLYNDLSQVQLRFDEMFKKDFAKLRLWHKNLLKSDKRYPKLCEAFEKDFNDLEQKTREAIQSNDFETIAENIFTLSHMADCLSEDLQALNVTLRAESLQKEIQSKLDQCIQKGIDHSEEKKLLLDDFISFQKNLELIQDECLSVLDSALSTTALHPYINIEALKAGHDNIISYLITFFHQQSHRFEQLVLTESTGLEQAKVIFKGLSAVRKLPEFELLTAEIYHKILGTLSSRVHEVKNDCLQVFDEFMRDQVGVDIKVLVDRLEFLKNMSWISEYKEENFHENILKQIQVKITKYLEGVRDQLAHLELDYQLLEDFEEGLKMIRKVKSLQVITQVDEAFSGIGEEIESINDTFMKKAKESFIKIEAIMHTEKQGEIISQRLVDLEALRSRYVASHGAYRLLDQADPPIRDEKSLKIMIKEAEDAIDTLKKDTSIKQQEDKLNQLRQHKSDYENTPEYRKGVSLLSTNNLPSEKALIDAVIQCEREERSSQIELAEEEVKYKLLQAHEKEYDRLGGLFQNLSNLSNLFNQEREDNEKQNNFLRDHQYQNKRDLKQKVFDAKQKIDETKSKIDRQRAKLKILSATKEQYQSLTKPSQAAQNILAACDHKSLASLENAILASEKEFETCRFAQEQAIEEANAKQDNLQSILSNYNDAMEAFQSKPNEESIQILESAKFSTFMALELEIKKVRDQEKFTQGLSGTMSRLDVSQVKQAFDYLARCERLPHIKLKANALRDNLLTYVNRYGQDEIKEQLSQSCDFIESVRQMSAGTQLTQNQSMLMEHGRFLRNRLGELKKIKTEHQDIYAMFDQEVTTGQDLLTYWQEEKLSQLYEQIRSGMQSNIHGNQFELEKQVLMAKSLRQVDPFMEEGRKFNDLLQQYEPRLIESFRLSQEDYQFIHQFNYEQVIERITNLRQTSNEGADSGYQKLKRLWSVAIIEQIQDLKIRIASLKKNMNANAEPLKQIVQQINKIKQVKNNFSEQDLNQSAIEVLNKFEDEIKMLLEEKLLSFIRSVDASIKSHYFSRVIDSMTFMQDPVIKVSLSPYLTTKVQEAIQTLDIAQASMLDEVVKKYLALEVPDYLHNIKVIHDKLAQAKHEGYGEEYEVAWCKIEAAVVQKMEALLDRAKKLPYLDARNEDLNQFQHTLKLLPDETQAKLSLQLESCKAGVIRQKQRKDLIMQQFIESDNTQEIAQEFLRLKNEKEIEDLEWKRTLTDKVMDNLNRYRDNIIKKLQQEGLTLDAKSIKYLIQYHQDLKEHVREVVNVYQEIKGVFDNIFKESCQDLSKHFVSHHYSAQEYIHLINAARTNFMTLIQFLKFNQNPQSQFAEVDLIALLPAEFEKSLLNVLEEVVSFYEAQHRDFHELIDSEQFKFIELDQLMMKIKSWEDFKTVFERSLKEVQPYDSTNQVKAILERIQSISSYQDKGILIEEKLIAFKNRLNAFNLLDEKTLEVKQREDFFHALETECLACRDVILMAKHVPTRDREMVEHLKDTVFSILRNKIKELEEDGVRLIDAEMKWDISQCREISHIINNLYAIEQLVDSLHQVGREGRKHVEEKIEERIGQIEARLKSSMEQNDVPGFAAHLIEMKMICDHVSYFKQRLHKKIEALLSAYRKASYSLDDNAIAELCHELNQDEQGIGQIITKEYDCFKGEGVRLFNQQTENQTPELILRDLRGYGLLSDAQVISLKDQSSILGQKMKEERKLLQGLRGSTPEFDAYEKDYQALNQTLNENDRIRVELESYYDEFNLEYNRLINTHLKVMKGGMDLEPLIIAIKTYGADIGSQIKDPEAGNMKWSLEAKASIPKLMAHIFALWTLQTSKYYKDAKGTQADEERKKYLLRPHVAQVISIFRMLGVVDKSAETLQGHMVQIKTGEGKSITLAVSACVLGLVGYEVSCASYSSYLSQRDYDDFRLLFDSLGLLNHIFYGTFNALCERVLNFGGPVRDRVRTTIENKPFELAGKSITDRKHILLIDEVDVFFDNSFYGKIYPISCQLKHESIMALTDHIWQHRDKLNVEQVKKTEAYQNCCNAFPGWERLIEEAVKDMVADVKHHDGDYIVRNDRIGYVEQDGVDFDQVYGYKTLFAYYFRHEVNREGEEKISEESLKKQVCINVRSGYFSYAEIAKPPYFECIMGVSGTLPRAGSEEERIIRDDYQVRQFTDVPSMFPARDLKFSAVQDTKVVSSEAYLGVIKTEIETRLTGTKSKQDNQRAVLVFFESESKLTECYESEVMKPLRTRGKIQIIKETLTTEEKEQRIKCATMSGQITFITRSYGRGTDFICHSRKVWKDGGIHTLQTFLGPYSEEIQIKGRSARQGQDGSYSIILDEKELETFKVSSEELEQARRKDEIPELLDNKRNERFDREYMENSQFIDEARKVHVESESFLACLNDPSRKEEMEQYLIAWNLGAKSLPKSRTICLLDATGSMGNLLEATKHTINKMFERAHTVLEEKGVEKTFEMQLVIYRNYNWNGKRYLLQRSVWSEKPEELYEFMTKVKAGNGLSPGEAVEMGLWHVNQEAQKEAVSQVILIGDAPANEPQEVERHRKNHGGEAYWAGYPLTNYEQELKAFNGYEIPIPVYAFYVDEYAKKSFEKIAALTSGKSKYLDVNSTEGATLLTDFVTEQVLMNVGGKELVNTYKELFGDKTYLGSRSPRGAGPSHGVAFFDKAPETASSSDDEEEVFLPTSSS